MTSNQYAMFLQRFIKNPKRVGSVLPSSRFLASKMVQSVSWDDVSKIAEFGSGTGAITRFIELRVNRSAIDKIDFVPLNFPPAFVYTCRKKEGI
ncbi:MULTISPECIES: hypothetical protein [Paenibacillus]|uniref:Uncharacterized protein n=1 Tax=Paenibacillus polymyxa TaxID=1406 RepID=A0AAP4A3H9_PAEPO|nr:MULTISPECIES: hypothetical protein [Paenibacillus]AIW41735.1 hypothetical protein X809_38185 [Paenibacillus polymyxa CR1]MDH2334540.1 hypothetical protein [Paenibacillus polymyxa]OMF70565.1 hypothetical protein BK143_16180 [Paenibacillus peoriae]